MYKLTISKLTDKPVTNWTISAKCEADQEGADPNIFVFHAKPDGDTFANIASLHDMNSLPVGTPTEIVNDNGKKEFIPFYRRSEVTLDFCNSLIAAHFVDIVRFDTKLLVREYKAAENLREEEILVV